MNKTYYDDISIEERQHFVSELHRFLTWVGEKPGDIKINEEIVNLNDIIWNCFHKKLSKNDREEILELIKKLEIEENKDENILLNSNLSKEEAKRLYHISAGLIRAIMDLKECESGKAKFIVPEEEELKIEDTKRWISFLKIVGKKFEF